MFFGRHPQPVVDPRPVAELTVRSDLRSRAVPGVLVERHPPERKPSPAPASPR